MAEDANFVFVLLFFSKRGTGKRSISLETMRMDEEEMFSPFELQKFL